MPTRALRATTGRIHSGNDIGGINVAFLVKTSRVSVGDCTQYGKDTTYIDPNTGMPAVLNDRPPVVLRATVAPRPGSAVGIPVTAIVNHLRSLSAVESDARVRAKREAQAEFLAGVIQPRQEMENIVSVGDYNAFEFNDGYVEVLGAIKGTPVPSNQVVVASPAGLVTLPLINLTEGVKPASRYSYVENGSAQVLDHVVLNTKLNARFSISNRAPERGLPGSLPR